MNAFKIRHATMMFGGAIPLLFLQLSCAAVGEHSAQEMPAALEATAEEAGLLAGTHASAGIACSDCHAESPPASAVPEAVCLTCHEDYQELTADLYQDPHNAHMAFPDCGSCHHMHQQSENQCMACHAFEG